jgi:hypothetical protein
MIRPLRRFCALLLVPVLLFAAGCSVPASKDAAAVSSAASQAALSSQSTPSSSPASSAAVSSAQASSSQASSAPVSSAEVSSSASSAQNAIQLSDFAPLKKLVKSTLYFDPKADYDTARTMRGSYDFNADGKPDAVTLNFSSVPDTGKKSTLTVGGAKLTLDLCGTAGLYAVSLNGSDRTLALVDYGMDNYVNTYFFRYDGKTLTQIGEISGSIETDPRAGFDFPEYNLQILADGKGRLIPRFGVMRYLSPNLVLCAEKFDGKKFTKLPVPLDGALGKTYPLAMDITPFFQPGTTNVSNPLLSCDDKTKVTLKKGQMITLISVNPTSGALYCSGVQLANGKKGILYFFLHP